MPARKRVVEGEASEPPAKRRSSRQAALAAAAAATNHAAMSRDGVKPDVNAAASAPLAPASGAKKGSSKGQKLEETTSTPSSPTKAKRPRGDAKKTSSQKGGNSAEKTPKDETKGQVKKATAEEKGETDEADVQGLSPHDAAKKPKGKKLAARPKAESGDEAAKSTSTAKPKTKDTKALAKTEDADDSDLDVDSLPTVNPEAPRHEGEWYWLMKAEPETRLENGIDVRFSIDDLRSKTKPEGWDGIRAYAARNHMRNMNAGDKAFFYHSNCKEPGIVGTMEIVKEFSEDTSARKPGTPYYDPQSTKENPRWSLVHVAFRKKFAVQIGLKELRELGKSGGPLEAMQMLKQTRLSVSRVSKEEWEALCALADEKAKEAGLEHEE